jgi:glycine/D-amino acid oxidase-like deaminating enzyme
MMRDLYSSLTSREQRAIRWSGAATAAALWLATAWADPWFLVVVPLVAGGYFIWLKRARRRGPQPDDTDWEF